MRGEIIIKTMNNGTVFRFARKFNVHVSKPPNPNCRGTRPRTEYGKGVKHRICNKISNKKLSARPAQPITVVIRYLLPIIPFNYDRTGANNT